MTTNQVVVILFISQDCYDACVISDTAPLTCPQLHAWGPQCDAFSTPNPILSGPQHNNVKRQAQEKTALLFYFSPPPFFPRADVTTTNAVSAHAQMRVRGQGLCELMGTILTQMAAVLGGNRLCGVLHMAQHKFIKERTGSHAQIQPECHVIMRVCRRRGRDSRRSRRPHMFCAHHGQSATCRILVQSRMRGDEDAARKDL